VCGIGNVSTLDACLRASLGLVAGERLAMLGHHVHLTAPADPDDEVRAWAGERPRLPPQGGADRRAVSLSQVAASFQRIALQSAVPQLVPKRYLGHAMGITQLTTSS
jgi:hypothetical protein